jgi:hypothetical protein
MQCAVWCNSFEVFTELLENGANIDATNTPTQMSLLELAASLRRLDMLRILLQRGASPDHCDENGIDVHFLCWASEDHSDKGTSATDTANVLGEYVALDPRGTWREGTILHIAAGWTDGHDIDALISCGHDVEAKNDDGETPITYAVELGNASTYLALLAHGADLDYSRSSVEKMLHKAVTMQAKTPGLEGLPLMKRKDYGLIIRHLLQHGSSDLNIAIKVDIEDEDFPASVQGHCTTPRQLAKAHGPKTEAWFLTLLLESGHPHYFTKKDKRRLHRLHSLRLGGYAPQGCIFGDDDDLSEYDDTDPSEDRTDDGDGDDDGYVYDHLQDRGGDASSIHEDTNDEVEEEQFWDAEQDL